MTGDAGRLWCKKELFGIFDGPFADSTKQSRASPSDEGWFTWPT
jgi:hypothetical protein